MGKTSHGMVEKAFLRGVMHINAVVVQKFKLYDSQAVSYSWHLYDAESSRFVTPIDCVRVNSRCVVEFTKLIPVTRQVGGVLVNGWHDFFFNN
jgi:hypothetical protein